MWPASPTRNSLPKRSGSATKLRSGAMLFSMEGSGDQLRRGLRGQSILQLGPEGVIRPLLGLVVERALNVVAAAHLAALAAECETALVVDIDQLVRDRRHVSQHAQPAKGVNLFVQRDRAGRHGRATDAMETVAAGDEIGLNPVANTVLEVAHAGLRAVKSLDYHLIGVVHGGLARHTAGVHQVARDLRLSIDHHPLAGQPQQVDAVALAAETQLDAVVRQTLLLHPARHAGLLQQVDRGLFEYAGANAAQHVIGAALLDHDVGDAAAAEQLP